MHDGPQYKVKLGTKWSGSCLALYETLVEHESVKTGKERFAKCAETGILCVVLLSVLLFHRKGTWGDVTKRVQGHVVYESQPYFHFRKRISLLFTTWTGYHLSRIFSSLGEKMITNDYLQRNIWDT